MNRLKKIAMVAILGLLNVGAYAAGPHDGVTCLGCHSAHFAVDHKIFAVKNTNQKNPLTKKSFDKLVAKNCLGCHQLAEYGGAGVKPIHMHTTHPIGMVPNPKIASVPKNMLKDGKLDCVSCHEAHPSNKNFMYLRVDTGATGENIQKLCAACHDAKVDYDSVGIKKIQDIKIFSAMDQEKGSGFFMRDEVRIENLTPEYVKPLGKMPENDLAPNYTAQPDWVYAPEINPQAELNKEIEAREKQSAKPKETPKVK
jgi:predicted CXXCH cytochrome family protein